MARPKKQQNISEIFEQFTSQLGEIIKESATRAVSEATECIFKGAGNIFEAKAPAAKKVVVAASEEAPKVRRRRRRKAGKKAVAKAAAPVKSEAVEPEVKKAE